MNILENVKIDTIVDFKKIIPTIQDLIDEAREEIHTEVDEIHAFCKEHIYPDEGKIIDDLMDSPQAICGKNNIPPEENFYSIDKKFYVLLKFYDREYHLYDVPVIVGRFDKKEDAEGFIENMIKFRESLVEEEIRDPDYWDDWEDILEDFPDIKEYYIIKKEKELY